MSTLDLFERSPFDVLVRNFFQENNGFNPVLEAKIAHPVDIYESDNGLHLDIACTGIKKDEISIQIQDDIIKVNYDRSQELENVKFLHKGIAKRAFDLGWKIAHKFNLSKATADFSDGLLKIGIPFSKGSELKNLKIS